MEPILKMDQNTDKQINENEIDSTKIFFKFIKLINKIRKQVLERNITEIVTEVEPELIEIRDRLASNDK